MRPMHRSLPIRLLLVFALLLSQLGGLTHGIAHTLEQHSQDQSQPHDRLCDLCASYAQLGSALGSLSPQITPAKQETIFVAAAYAPFRSNAFTAFAARAPPYSV